MYKLKITGNRYKDNPVCPCGKSNKDYKFTTYIGCENKPFGYCHSCDKDFKNSSVSDSIQTPIFKKQKQCFFNPRLIYDHLDLKLNSNFTRFLSSYFGVDKTIEVVKKYHIGLYNHDVVFWQLDQFNSIRAGKVMKYNTNGRRKEYVKWWHKLNNQNCRLNQCFFGEHLTNSFYPIAIVESEKTACIMSIIDPRHVWIASGGSSGLRRKCNSIKGFKAVLFPDQGQYDNWKEISDQIGFKISSVCEKWFNEGSIKKGEDIADYFLNRKKPIGSP